MNEQPTCPGYDVCPVSMCGCRWLGLGSPWRGVMMIYRSEQHAVIRAITSGQQGNIKAQAWQQLAESGWPEEGQNA